FIGLDGSFAPWVGALIPELSQPIIFIAPEGRSEEVVTRLSRVGYDNTLGYLEGGLAAWEEAGKEVDTIDTLSAEALAEQHSEKEPNILDVRKESEFNSGHIEGATNFPLDYINENMEEVDNGTDYKVHCAGGYRSVIAISILKSRGIHNVVDIAGGYKSIKETDIPTKDMVSK
ncbi:MAG: rhodanese-like domain-containing protein, partial [Cyclobacteriaceae bacterium]